MLKDKNKFKYSVINTKGQEIIPVKGISLLATLSSDESAAVNTNKVPTVNDFVDTFAFLSHKNLKGNSDTIDISNG